MSILKFLGEDIFNDNVSGEPIQLEKDKEYEAQVQRDAPGVIINKVHIDNPDATYWVVLNDDRTQIPYAKECLERLWQVVKM